MDDDEGNTSTQHLKNQILDALPQTQCTKCGFNGCAPYAQTIAENKANYNQCPPGGEEGVARLAKILGRPVIPLNVVHGEERPRHVAKIDPERCIGCTLCIQACPVDAIVGTSKHMHTVLSDWCTGCDLCVAPCPVDCISMEVLVKNTDHPPTGWQAWSDEQAKLARVRHERRQTRLAIKEKKQKEKVQKLAQQNTQTIDQDEAKKALIAQALARAKARG